MKKRDNTNQHLTKEIYKGNFKAGEIELLEMEIAFQNAFTTLYNDHVLFPNGQKGQYLRLTWNMPVGAIALPILENGDVCLVRNFRHPIRKWSIEIPRGFGKHGESPLDTAVRELREETGLEAKEMLSLGFVTPDTGVLATRAELFLARDCRRMTSVERSKEAIKEILVKPYQQVVQMAIKGEIEDGYTIAALFRVQHSLNQS